MTAFEIEIIFDFVCAWCYIAKRQHDHAISLYKRTYPDGKHDVFAITWRPYYLNYNPHPHSVDKSVLAETKLADMTPERRAALTRRMDQIGRSIGINFAWGGIIGPDTRDAHRLVRLGRSQGPGVQDAVVEGLFEAYHELERDISDKEVLRGVAVAVGMDAVEVEEFLASDTGTDEVDEEEKRTREVAGGSGVPTFVIQGVHRLEGAQDPSDIYEVFVKVKEAETGAG
ncbi:DSBA-like thioredoxin domain-containing protein [Colletotrichum sojae]|uniref:DSBA-like thioredoxin domain-containing protein n=1 Tax=Colletotrichum sojae TaxID=2175907 RepID=A0A8H6ITX2_9PEZI|nr:DSBA-like thioredoxin domain-containing protein [Colletotrichum sojae]